VSSRLNVIAFSLKQPAENFKRSGDSRVARAERSFFDAQAPLEKRSGIVVTGCPRLRPSEVIEVFRKVDILAGRVLLVKRQRSSVNLESRHVVATLGKDIAQVS
jgi:hypothetical protein